MSPGDPWVSGDGPGHRGLTARRLGSVGCLVRVGAARALLPEVDRADRLPCRPRDGFEIAVEVEEGESRFFRGCGYQEVHGPALRCSLTASGSWAMR